jgi:hypothetical protein
MDVFGKWSPLVKGLGALVGFVFFLRSANELWRRRQQKKLLSRPRKSDKSPAKPGEGSS